MKQLNPETLIVDVDVKRVRDLIPKHKDRWTSTHAYTRVFAHSHMHSSSLGGCEKGGRGRERVREEREGESMAERGRDS
jgi:hypothetical protein